MGVYSAKGLSGTLEAAFVRGTTRMRLCWQVRPFLSTETSWLELGQAECAAGSELGADYDPLAPAAS